MRGSAIRSRGRRPRPAAGGLVPGPNGWWLAPEGAAVRPEIAAAVIADVHLGYEWARAVGGDMVPAHSLAETIAKLDRLMHRLPVNRLIVAGDCVESRIHCPRTSRDVAALAAWLERRGVRLERLAGNHDPIHGPRLPSTVEVAGWTLAHGHLEVEAERVVIGHYHPILYAAGVQAPCFVVSERQIVLPAFSPNAAGQDATRLGLPDAWRDEQARVIAGLGEELLDFGSLAGLSARG